MSIFVLAHLSDPHLPPLPMPNLAALLGKRALGFINWRRRRHLLHRAELLGRIVRDLKARAPDHIAVTGDLVNLSLANEYPPARAWLQGLGAAQDVTLVPGNHDIYVREAAEWPQLYWGDYMRGDAGETGFPFVRRRGPLALVGLSSANVPPPFWATGFIGVDQLRRLAAALEQLGGENLFRVVLVHHPARSKPSRHFKRLVDGRAFREVLAQHGAELVIHGHDHVHSLAWLEGPRAGIPAVGVPSASQAPAGKHAPAGYNLYRIAGMHGAWHCEMVSRSLDRDGGQIVEIGRIALRGSQAYSNETN